MREFKIIQEHIIPQISKEWIRYNVSDRYFGIAENLAGEQVKVLCYYDFKYNKWCFDRSGIKQLIEYYD